MTHAGAVLVAAGHGRRLGGGPADPPKALVEVAGRPLLAFAIEGLRAVPSIVHLVVVHPPGAEQAFRDVAGPAVTLAVGGPTRAASVRAGVAALPEDVDLVVIHDAARPLVPPAVVRRTLAAVSGDVVAAAPGLPVRDTLKRVDVDGGVQATVPRNDLWAAHTPQVVRRDVLAAVLAGARAPEATATDDLGLVEDAVAAGVVAGRVVLVRGDPQDLKITYPEDLRVVAALVGARSSPAPTGAPRIGHGFDVHAFSGDPARPLVLAGVTIADTPGLAGHSDADVVAHALADALLGAAAMGDLGSVFGTDDPGLSGAGSLDLLRRVVALVEGAGWTVGNVDLTVVAERPRLAGQVGAMQARLSECLSMVPTAVSVKVTSTDGVGALGGGEGIACLATCLLLPGAPAADNRLADRRTGGDR